MSFENKWMKDGKIICIPRKDSSRIDLLGLIINNNFEKDKMYSEKEVNNILKEYYNDFAFLRRLMIEYKLLQRDLECSTYWVKVN